MRAGVVEAGGDAPVIRNGIISARTLTLLEAKEAAKELSAVEWRASTVGQKHDAFRVKELVDKSQRDALSAGFDRAFHIGQRLLSSIAPKVFLFISNHWGLTLRHTSSPQFTLYKPGHFISAHRDSGAAYPDRLFSVVTYLTDEYSGGEIFFPVYKNQFHPECGTSLIFPSDEVHGVHPVRDGTKLIFLFFVDRAPQAVQLPTYTTESMN